MPQPESGDLKLVHDFIMVHHLEIRAQIIHDALHVLYCNMKATHPEDESKHTQFFSFSTVITVLTLFS